MILETAQKAEDLSIKEENYFFKGLLCGPSGSGKTTGSTTLPGKKLLIDLDDRKESVAGLPDIEVISINEENPRMPRAWQKLLALKEELRNSSPFPYSGVIIDGLTSMGRLAMHWALLLDRHYGLGGVPAQQHYMPQMKELTEFTRGVLTLPCHIIFAAHLDIVEDTVTGDMRIFPKTTGKLRTEIPSWFNEVYLCQRSENEKGKYVYSWTTIGTGREDFLKSSLNQLNKYWTDPVIVDFNESPRGIEKLLRTRFEVKQ